MPIIEDERDLAYGSLFAGIGGFDLALKRVGMRCAWQVEIDRNCQRVLAHHWPNVERMSDVKDCGAHNLEQVDLIVGGFPCQDLSIAGHRAGLAGERSGLWFEFLRIIKELKPRWVIIENVPGLLNSNKGNDIRLMLNSLEGLRYVIDCDILDAQYFGVPQRRKRVFVICQHADDILKKKMTSSAQTIAQCLIEILGDILVEVERLSLAGRSDLDFANSRDGLMRRIKLFGIAQESLLVKLRDNLDVELERFHPGGKRSVMDIIGGPEEGINQTGMGGPLLDTSSEGGTLVALWSTDSLWNNILAEIYYLTKSFTTLTVSSPIAESKIFFYAKAALAIARFISLSRNSCPTYWNAASSALMVIEEYISYATQASRSLFTGLEWLCPWSDFVRQAKQVRDAILDIGTSRAAEVLFESESSPWDIAPSREAGEKVASTLAAGAHPGGFNGRDIESGNIVYGLSQSSHPLGSLELAEPITIRHGDPGMVAHPLAAHHGRNCGEDTFIPIAFDTTQITSPHNRSNPKSGDPCHTLNANAHPPALAFDWQSGGDVRLNISDEHTSALQKSQTPAVQTRWGVRRFTPLECERLQGFPDQWTNVNGMSDSARYKMLGNAVAVPVVQWIGEHIIQAELESDK